VAVSTPTGFVVQAGTTSNVPIGLTDLDNQVATGPGGYEAQVIVEMKDYDYLVEPKLAPPPAISR
jgi:hypothetical protein